MGALAAHAVEVLGSPEVSGASPMAVYLARLAPSGRRGMAHALEVVAGLLSGEELRADRFPWHRLRGEHTQALRPLLAARYAPRMVNKVLAAVRGVLLVCWEGGLMGSEEYHRAKAVRNVAPGSVLAGRRIPAGELRALVAACGGGLVGARDAALLALLYAGGLRRSEAVGVDLEHLDHVSGRLVVRAAKGGHHREVYLCAGALDAVRAWVALRGETPGPLLCSVKDGRLEVRRLTDLSVYLRVERLATLAGVPGVTPHDLRRSCVSDLLDAGVDLATVQRMAGHASASTTAGYDRRGQEVQRAGWMRLHFPTSG